MTVSGLRHLVPVHGTGGARATRALPAPARAGSALGTATVASRVVLAVLVVTAALVSSAGGSWTPATIPLAIGLLLVGLPHGAADAAAPWLRAREVRAGRLLVAAVVYVALAGATWALCTTWPGVGLALLLVGSVLHFGRSELTVHRCRGASVAGAPFAAATGLVVVVLPLLTHAAGSAPDLALMVPGWDGTVPAGPVTLALWAVVLLAAGVVVRLLVRGDLTAAADLCLLGAAAWVAPPAVSIAVYFAFWHSTRHLALLAEDATGPTGPGLRLLVLRTAPASAVAFAAVAALWFLVAHGQPAEFLRHQIWMLAALTVPHAAVVEWLDRTRRTRRWRA